MRIGSRLFSVAALAMLLTAPAMAQQKSEPAHFNETRYELAGFLMRAGVICKQDAQRMVTAGLALLGSSELKAISRNFPDTTRRWMTAGAEKFNTSVMDDGVAEACALLSDH